MLPRRLAPISARCLSNVAAHDPSKFRNMALVAHIDSGKTTLTESILLSSSYISTPGSVDTGSTTTDFLPAERERGITIQSASIPVHWKDWRFNLIDTPGHADFGMEVESASRVVDGAVVLIDSVEGVEAQTRGVWRQLNRYNVASRLVFFNKLDRPGASFRSSLLSLLSHGFHPKPMVLTLPVASFDPADYRRAEPGVQGLIDLVKWELWKWDSDGQAVRHPLPRSEEDLQNLSILPASHPIIPHLLPARTTFLDNLSMCSEELMDKLLSSPSFYLTLESSDIMPHLRGASLRNDILPVLCGSAMRHIGTELVMDYVGALLASPLDIPHDKQTNNSPVRLLAWKVSWDKRRGWMTFVRVYSGTLTKQTALLNVNQNERERVSKLLLLYASEVEEIDALPFGSVGVILGLKNTRTGDTLVSAHGNKASREGSSLPTIVPPPPVMSASIIPQSHSDLDPVQAALQALARTDPSVRVDNHEGQILIHGLGALHLEIVEGRLRDEWNVRFESGRRRVNFREGLGSHKCSPEMSTHNHEIGGQLVAVSIHLELRPLGPEERGDPAWDGNVVLDAQGRPFLSPESYDPTDPQGQIARGLASALSCSPHTSLPMSHLHVKVLEARYPSVDGASSLLVGASLNALRSALHEAGMGPLMEPYIWLKVSVPENSLGKVVKDLTETGGEVLSLTSESNAMIDGTDGVGGFPQHDVYVPPEWLSPSASSGSITNASARMKQTISALAPLSRMLDYSNRLRALSGGHGLFETANAGFREVSETRKKQILQEIGRA